MMKENELKELLALLEESGLQPMLCDAAVPLSSCPVKCGIPVEPGDAPLDYIPLPKVLVGSHPEMFIPAQGDSMRDAGYEDGDRLRVMLGVAVHDGDDVLACLDGECTVKTLFTDDRGRRWLVPRNENYKAILLTETMNVRLLGVVTAVEKQSPRASFRECQRAVLRTQSSDNTPPPVTDADVDAVIRLIAAEVRHARQWYAVMRALVDHKAIEATTYAAFCQRVHRLVPDHAHLPTSKELQRMAVQSFAKRVDLWDRHNAPVSGIRYDEYLLIARHTAETLLNTALSRQKTR